MSEEKPALNPLVNPINKNVKYDLTKLTPEYVEKINLGTAGVDTKSFSKEDLGGMDIKSFQKETGTGTSVLNKQILQDQSYFNDLKEKNATIKNDINAYNQGTLDKVGNGIVKFGGRVYTSVVGSTVGTLYGLYAWAKDGEFKSFYDNDFQHSLDGVNDYLAQEYKHYYTSSKDDWEVGNFIFDKVFDGLGFATGAVLSSLIGGGITSGVQKFTNLTNFFKQRAVNVLKETAKGTTKTQQAINTANTINKLQNITGLSQNLPKSLVALTTGAVYESGVEARHGFSETKELLIESYKKNNNGKAPSEEDMKEINNLSGQTANGIFAANMAIVGGGNILQFGKHIGLDYKEVTSLLNPAIAKNIVMEGGETAFKSRGSKFIRGATAVLKNPIVESQEEMLQSVITGTGTDYALSKYNSEGREDTTSLLTSSIKAFKKTYNSKEGWEEGLIGAIIGSTGVVAPSRIVDPKTGKKSMPLIGGVLKGGIVESVSDWKKSETKRDEIIDNLNKKGSVSSLKEGITHHIRDSRLEKIKDSAIDVGSAMHHKTAQDDQFHSFVISRIDAGMVDSVYDDLVQLKNMPIEDVKKALGIPEDIEFPQDHINKQIDSFIRRAKSIQQSIKFVDKVYRGGNPEIREALIYDQSMINRIEERMKNISTTIQDLTGGTSVALNITNEKGERLTKKELFANVPRTHEGNRKEFEQAYDDYNALDKRANLLLEELTALLNPKEESQQEAKLNNELKEIINQAERVKAAKDKAKKEQEKIDKDKQLKKDKANKANKKSELDELNDTTKTVDLEPKESEERLILPLEEENKLISNIKSTKDIGALNTLIKQSGNTIKNLPFKVQVAITDKVTEFDNERRKLEQEQTDPLNASGNTVVDDSVKQDIINNINDGVDLNEPPIDATKIKDSEIDLQESHEGETTTGIDNKEVRENGETILTIDGRLVDAHNTIATSTRKFIINDKGYIVQLDELNEKSNLDVLSSELLQAGDPVTVNLYTEDYLEVFNSDGTLAEPLKNEFGINQIMTVNDSSNIVIGYIHELGYITADRVYETLGKEDNLERNKQLLTANRKKVFDHINNTGQPYRTTIEGKSSGSVLVKANGRYDTSIKEAIGSDTRPQILVVKEDGFYLGGNHIKDTDLADKVFSDFKEDFYTKYKGSTMIAIPTANGKYVTKFVNNPTLATKSHIQKLIKDTLLAYINEDIEFIESLGIDYSRNSISDYINNFIYTNSDISSPYRFSLSINEADVPNIKFKDKEGTTHILNKDNMQAIKELDKRLAESYIAVNLKLINVNPIIRTKNDKGVFVDVKYMEFLKENLNVNFFGRDIRNDTERVYVANPVIALDFDNNIQISPNIEEEFKEDEFLPLDDSGNIVNQTQKPNFSTTSKPNVTTKAKKADIERRRQEELNNNEQRYSSELNKLKKQAEGEIKRTGVRQLVTGNRIDSYEGLIAGERFKINDKYDAELAALEQVKETKQKPKSIKNSSLGSLQKKSISEQKAVSLQIKKDNISQEEIDESKKECEL